MNPVQLVLDRLRQRGIEPRPSGDSWTCRCPAHEGKGNKSLSVSPGDNGGAVLHCFGRCTTDAVAKALGLTLADLCAGPGPGRAAVSRLGPSTTKREKSRQTFPTWEAAVKSLASRLGQPSRTWQYTDADGVLVGVVVRWDGDDGKEIRPVSRQADGRWACAGMPELRPLYGLPDLLTAETVYIVEGEKAADAIVSLGLVATTSPHGALSPDKADWTPLCGKRVVILPDRDEPGEKYAADVVKLVTAAGAADVKVVRLADLWPEIPAGGDAADWLAHHGTGDVGVLRGAIESLVEKSRSAAPPAVSPASRDDDVEAIPLETRPWPSRPSTMLTHGIVGDLLVRVEEETEADPVAIATTFLVAIGNVIGRGPYAVVDGNRHGVNLFATIIGGTSEGRKGTSLSIARAVLRGIDDDWARNCRTSNLTSGEGLIDLIRDEVVATREDKKTGAMETYIAATGVDDKRLLFECQEFAAAMRAGKSDRSTLFPIIREAWDGQDLRTATKTNPRRVTDPHVSGVAHITPEELFKLQTDADIFGGTWNRFLWIAARRARLCPHGGDFEDLTELQDRVRSVVNHAQNVGRMRRTAAADRLWEAEYYRRADSLPGGTVGAILGRAEAQILRLSMLAALCRRENVVDECDLAAALDLWRYVDETVRMLFSHGEDPVVLKIVSAVRTAPGISRADLHRQVAKGMPAGQFMAALSRAATMGAIVRKLVETRGRTREEWYPRDLEKSSRPSTGGPDPFSTFSPFSPPRTTDGPGGQIAQPAAGAAATGSRFGRTL